MSVDPSVTRHLLTLLQRACTATTSEEQREISKGMDEFIASPLSNTYLLSIVLYIPNHQETIPSALLLNDDNNNNNNNLQATLPVIQGMAGLILKNNLSKRRIDQETMLSIQQNIPLIIASLTTTPTRLLRTTIGSLLGSILKRCTPSTTLPTLLPTLFSLKQSLPAIEAIRMICEDAQTSLLNDPSSPIEQVILPGLLGLLHQPNVAIKVEALRALTTFLKGPSSLLFKAPDHRANVDVLMATLSTLAATVVVEECSREQLQLHLSICEAARTLIEGNILQIGDHDTDAYIGSLMPFILNSMQLRHQEHSDAQLSIALEASEFFLSILSSQEYRVIDLLEAQEGGSLLNTLIAVLLKNICFLPEDAELEIVLAEEQQQAKEEEEEDDEIAPHGRTVKKENVHSGGGCGGRNPDSEDEDEEDGEIASNINADSEEESAGDLWTLRKCSAATIDALSIVLGNCGRQDVFALLLSSLQSTISESADWRLREGAILAIGAMAPGIGMLSSSFSELNLPFLMNLVLGGAVEYTAQQAGADFGLMMICSISCWTASRLLPLLMEVSATNEGEEEVKMVIDRMVSLLDPSSLSGVAGTKRIREAALSSIWAIINRDGGERAVIVGGRDVICALLKMLQFTFTLSDRMVMTSRSILSVIVYLIEKQHLPQELFQLYSVVLGQFRKRIGRWSMERPLRHDYLLFPLAESLSYLCDGGLVLVGQEVWEPCLEMIKFSFTKWQAELSNPIDYMDDTDWDYGIVAIDLIGSSLRSAAAAGSDSGSLRTLGSGSAELLKMVCQIVCLFADSSICDVRQCVFAFVGDLYTSRVMMLDSKFIYEKVLISGLVGPLVGGGGNCSIEHGISSVGSVANAAWALGEVVGWAKEIGVVDEFTISLLDSLSSLLCFNGISELEGRRKYLEGARVLENVAIGLGKGIVSPIRDQDIKMVNWFYLMADVLAYGGIDKDVEKYQSVSGMFEYLSTEKERLLAFLRSERELGARILNILHLLGKYDDRIMHYITVIILCIREVYTCSMMEILSPVFGDRMALLIAKKLEQRLSLQF